MTGIKVNGVRLNYLESGNGPETVVFAHGLLMNHRMYQPQQQALSDSYRCIAYDHRGQGDSEVTPNGYDMDNLATDAAELIRKLDAAPCHFIGLSMGGFVGLRLGIRQPELLRSLTLIDTSADPEPQRSRRKFALMIGVARWFGFRPLVPSVVPVMFGPRFLHDPARSAEIGHWKSQLLAADRAGVLRSARAVIQRKGVHDMLHRISTPTLVLVGEEDTATPPVHSERLRDGIAGARLAVIPGSGHHAPIEQAEAVTAEITAFLDSISGANDARNGVSPA